MNSQMEGDAMLAEHRAVMAALIKSEINRPTEEQYADQLRKISEEMQCQETTGFASSSPSQGASL